MALLAAASCAAQAQHRLFLTDVLDSGEREVLFTATHFRSKERSGPLSFEHRAIELDARASVGLGGGWQLVAGLPYYPQNKNVSRFDGLGIIGESDGNGWGDLQLGARYLLQGNRSTPSTFALQATVQLDTAPNGQAGANSTSLVAELLGSLRLSEHWRPHGSLIAVEGTGRSSRALGASAGMYYTPAGDAWHIQATLTAIHNTGGDGNGPRNAFFLQLAAPISIARRWYFVPGVVLRRSNSYDSGGLRFENGRSQSLTAGIYGLF